MTAKLLQIGTVPVFEERYLWEQGRRAAEEVPVQPWTDAHQWRAWIVQARQRAAVRQQDLARAFHRSLAEEALWLSENARLIQTARREVREARRSFRHLPMTVDCDGTGLPRVCLLATRYLDAVRMQFNEDGLVAFLNGYQSVTDLDTGEIWAMKAALEGAILDRLASAAESRWPLLIASLQRVAQTRWTDLVKQVSIVEHLLRQDPAGVYVRMDADTRALYRQTVVHVARHSDRTEREVAEAVVELAREYAMSGAGGNDRHRRTHVGFYLLDQWGREDLRRRVRYCGTRIERVRETLSQNGTWFYVFGIEVVTLLLVGRLVGSLNGLTTLLAALLLGLPATQVAVCLINNLVGLLLPPQRLPKLDFSKGIPEECRTLVAVPTLLLSESQVYDLTLDLEIRYLANRDRNLYFALVTDLPDSTRDAEEGRELVKSCARRIEALNRRYATDGRQPFLLLHRARTFNANEGRWMGWERKRGKLVELNRLLCGVADNFPTKRGDLTVLESIRYVITLDEDTQLPRESAAKLVGALAHPLNRPVIDPVSHRVVEGYGILQPRIGISTISASRSYLSSLLSGETGFDIYTRAVSNAYQDLCGAGIFTGKGIYDVRVLQDVLDNRFPDNALLSHDLLEGEYARAGLVSDIELIDDFPSDYSAYCRRKHRWIRGDWQIVRWLLPRVPTGGGNLVENALGGISRWKIADNLRRSLFEPATLVLLLAGWFWLPRHTIVWTAVGVGVLLAPAYISLLCSLLRMPLSFGAFRPWLARTFKGAVRGHVLALMDVALLLHQALVSTDAVVRSVWRVFVSRRKLLEWETANQAQSAARRRSTVDRYLACTPALALLIGFALWATRSEALLTALPVLLSWLLVWPVVRCLEMSPRLPARGLREDDAELLRESASRAWRYFRDWSTEATNWLIPDSVREDGTHAMRLSPTNLGFLLNARVCAVRMGMLSIADFAADTMKTLERVDALEKFRGHLLNWYDIETLATLSPRFVSTVDSGNLAACLWTTKQAALHFADRFAVTPAVAAQLRSIARICGRLVDEMDFRFLYNERKKVLHVGYDAERRKLEPAGYTLLASESRIATFIAIAKGDIPQDAWFHLDRRLMRVLGEPVLMSWTGTMFEYLMPSLWMRHLPGTILRESVEAAVRVQQRYGRLRGVPWGISESCCAEGDGDYRYYAFGVPDLALKETNGEELVVAPYATLLAVPIDSHGALENLRRMKALDWYGRYGFYEAADHSQPEARLVRSWMAHHQGMGLLAACNALHNNAMVRYFHAEPAVKATELLLDERVPGVPVTEVSETRPDAVFGAEGAA